MIDLQRYAARVIVRRLIYILIAATISFCAAYTGTAQAQYESCYTDSSQGHCETSAQARHRVDTLSRSQLDYKPFHWTTSPELCGPWKESVNAYHGGTYQPGYQQCTATSNTYVAFYRRTYDQYEPDAECVGDDWPDPSYPGQCLNKEKCEMRNADIGTGDRVGGANRYFCAGGCEIGFTEPGAVCVDGDCKRVGPVAYTGYKCDWRPSNPNKPTDPAPPLPEKLKQEPDPNACEAIQGTQVCAKSNGDVCATATTGKRICWSPHETGQKTEKDVVQQKKPGHQDGPPSISISNGDTATKKGNDAKVTATDRTGHTSNTTITNYVTNSGANAGNNNQGEGDDGDKDGDGEYGGGADCSAPPTSKGDPQLSGIIDQQWRTRCANDKNNDGQPDWTEVSGMSQDGGEGQTDADLNFWAPESIIDGSNLDKSGFGGGGGGTCPALSVSAGSGLSGEFAQYLVSPPPIWCAFIGGIYWIVVTLASMAGIYILAGKKD